MARSKLIDYVLLSPNCSKPRNAEIDTITIHHVVGQLSVETLGLIMANPERDMSSNYGIGEDGRIALYCEEENRSWCSSSASNDNRAITIEVSNNPTPPYAVSDKVMESLIELLVDICKRNPKLSGGLRWQNDKTLIGQVDKQNMTVHQWFSATGCPGEYLLEKHGCIAEEVNRRLNPIKPNPPTGGAKLLYKVIIPETQVGAFHNKDYAEAYLEKVKKDYPNAFIKED